MRSVPRRRLHRGHHHVLDLPRGDRGRSAWPRIIPNPSRRNATNRDRHLPTVGCDTPTLPATSLLLSPSTQPSTIRDRNANACDDFRRRAHRTNCSRSWEVNSNSTFGRPVRGIPSPTT